MHHLPLLVSLGIGTAALGAAALFWARQQRSRRREAQPPPPGRIVIAANLASSRQHGRQRIS